jgi:hypothetical protein
MDMKQQIALKGIIDEHGGVEKAIQAYAKKFPKKGITDLSQLLALSEPEKPALKKTVGEMTLEEFTVFMRGLMSTTVVPMKARVTKHECPICHKECKRVGMHMRSSHDGEYRKRNLIWLAKARSLSPALKH